MSVGCIAARKSQWPCCRTAESGAIGQHCGWSATAKFFGLSGEEEARGYLEHPLLGPRYRESVAAVRGWVDAGKSLEAIFGDLDAMKFRSSVEIFET
jgi:uncharacterized protein (DUF1810 family)